MSALSDRAVKTPNEIDISSPSALSERAVKTPNEIDIPISTRYPQKSWPHFCQPHSCILKMSRCARECVVNLQVMTKIPRSSALDQSKPAPRARSSVVYHLSHLGLEDIPSSSGIDMIGIEPLGFREQQVPGTIVDKNLRFLFSQLSLPYGRGLFGQQR